jgi:hypothetical protein
MSSTRALTLMIVACGLVLGVGGCGEEEGTAKGATVTAYVSAQLCEQAKARLRERGPLAGEVRLRVACLPDAGRSSGELDLAALGAGARRVTEDSSAVAFAESAGQANRIVPPIVEAAGIAITYTSSGALAINRIVRALESAGDADSIREGVAEEMDGLFPD